MFVYPLDPIDFWPGWLSEAQYKASLEEVYSGTAATNAWSAYDKLLLKAKKIATEAGWEGDIREGPFIAGLPLSGDHSDTSILIAWKQDNNGQTFVASPVPLPWLKHARQIAS